LVDLIRQFRDDDGYLATLVDGLEMGACTNMNAATPGFIGFPNAAGAIDNARGREVRTRHVGHPLVDRNVFILDQRQAGIADLMYVVRWDVGRHPHGNTGATID